jgi:hypothetical protein
MLPTLKSLALGRSFTAKSNVRSLLRLCLVVAVSWIFSASASPPCSYVLPLPARYSAIANQCDHPSGINSLNNIFPNVPACSFVLKWNPQIQGFDPPAFFNGASWNPNITLDPGEGAFFFNPGPATSIAISGNSHTPVLPTSLPSVIMLSRQDPAPATFNDIVAVPAQEGDAIFRWDSASNPQGFSDPIEYFEDFGWYDPNTGGLVTIVANVGESIFIRRVGGGGSGGSPAVIPGAVCGMVFNDLNGNGAKDAGEPGLQGWTITLSGPTTISTTTDSLGAYFLATTVSGNYTLAQTLQAGWQQTFPASGTYSIGVGPGGMNGLDFGNHSTAVAPHCSFTQGFWGNPNGKFNGITSWNLLNSLLAQGPLVVGKASVRSLTIQPADALLLEQRLPAGGGPATLPAGNQSLATAVLPLLVKGNGIKTFKNILLGQTITLSLNTRLNASLLNFALPASFCTVPALPGTDTKLGTSDDQPDTSGGAQKFTIPGPVLSALANAGLPITVAGLLDLANRALAAQATTPATLSEINDAVDAINRGFDECRMLVDCSSYPIVPPSPNDGFGGGTGLSPAGGPAPFLARVSSNTNYVRLRGSNLEATKESYEPDHAGNPGGKSVWWHWPASKRGWVAMQTAGSSFDTLLAVYRGTSLSDLTLVAQNDDARGFVSSEVVFNAESDTIYHIAVDGYDAASGSIQLQIASDVPRLGLPFLLGSDEVEIRVESEVTRTYGVEASSDLVHWTEVAVTEPSDGNIRFRDPAPSPVTARFYRLVFRPD